MAVSAYYGNAVCGIFTGVESLGLPIVQWGRVGMLGEQDQLWLLSFLVLSSHQSSTRPPFACVRSQAGSTGLCLDGPEDNRVLYQTETTISSFIPSPSVDMSGQPPISALETRAFTLGSIKTN